MSVLTQSSLVSLRLHVIQDDTKSGVALETFICGLSYVPRDRVRATRRMFGKTCSERHDRRCFDGAPCGRDQWALVGAVDSFTQGQLGERITVSSVQIHTERVVDISMHTDRDKRL